MATEREETSDHRLTSSSWMNLVERFFRNLAEFITEKSFASTRALADAIIAFLAARKPDPAVGWKARGEDLLRKDRCCQAGARRAAAPSVPQFQSLRAIHRLPPPIADRLDPVTGAPQRRYEIAPATEGIAFGNAGRLWAVSEAGSRHIFDHPFLDLFQTFFPLVFTLDPSRLE